MLDLMLRPLSDIDEVKMIGARPLASIPIPAATLAEHLGLELRRDPDFMPGLGTFQFFTCELGNGVLFTVASNELTPDLSAVFAHHVADLSSIARALGVDIGEFDAEIADPPKPWLVIRQDDNGNRAVLNRCETRSQADKAADMWTRRMGTHHQLVLVESA